MTDFGGDDFQDRPLRACAERDLILINLMQSKILIIFTEITCIHIWIILRLDFDVDTRLGVDTAKIIKYKID